MIKYNKIMAISLLLLIPSVGQASWFSRWVATPVNNIAAVVNKNPITTAAVTMTAIALVGLKTEFGQNNPSIIAGSMLATAVLATTLKYRKNIATASSSLWNRISDWFKNADKELSQQLESIAQTALSESSDSASTVVPEAAVLHEEVITAVRLAEKKRISREQENLNDSSSGSASVEVDQKTTEISSETTRSQRVLYESKEYLKNKGIDISELSNNEIKRQARSGGFDSKLVE